MSEPKINLTTCASCGLPGHRYGRNEGPERYDPMACINTLRNENDRLRALPSAAGGRVAVTVAYDGKRARWVVEKVVTSEVGTTQSLEAAESLRHDTLRRLPSDDAAP